MTPRPLAGLRVVDHTSGIAGPYCTKFLVDAGADVAKIEPRQGDPMRRSGSGALFEYLNAGKRSVLRGEALASEADVVLSDDPRWVASLPPSSRPRVVATITPFGRSGPWSHRPWTEFTLQAACGSTGQRGVPEKPPLAAGGRVGEWVAGTYAALAILAALHGARVTGAGTDIDLAIFDCMAVTMVTYPSVFASFTGWPPLQGTGRTIQVPSIEPTSDGCFVVTTNSAQQFHDFLVMIDRSDLLDDPELAHVAKRFARRDEFLAAVRQHTLRRTTSEVLEEAALFRLPAAPVLDAAGVLSFEQFTARQVFERSASGRFVQPRVPYVMARRPGRATAPAPAIGEHEGETWPASSRPRPAMTSKNENAQLPLQGMRIVDCTAWWAGPSATHALATLGADVVKVESVTKPDPMRLTSVRRPPEDRWWEWGPIFHAVNGNKRALTLDLGSEEGLELLHRLLASADVLIENFTPRVMEQFGLDWDSVHARNPRLVMVRMPAFGLDGPWRDRTGFAQTMEAVTGLSWRTGFPDELPTLVLGACDPVAGMHAAAATLLALGERDATGKGLLVESVMVEAALNVAAEAIVEFSCSGSAPSRNGNRSTDAAPQGLYPCAGHDTWVAVSVATDAQWVALAEVLGRPDWVATMMALADRRAGHDEIDAVLAAWAAGRDVGDAVDLLSSAGVPAEEVVAARDVVHNQQLQHRNLFETERHPVTGAHAVPMLPFHFSGHDHWLRTPSPTLGQHNEELLRELGLGPEEQASLRRAGVIGDDLAGA